MKPLRSGNRVEIDQLTVEKEALTRTIKIESFRKLMKPLNNFFRNDPMNEYTKIVFKSSGYNLLYTFSEKLHIHTRKVKTSIKSIFVLRSSV